MTLFDFAFGLTAVILGLGLADMASRFQQLVFAGRRVKWAPEPVVLSALVFLVIIVVWLSAWRHHGAQEVVVWEQALQILAILGPYMVAAAVFPRVPDQGALDLHQYYDRNRKFLFGTLLVGQLIYWSVGLVTEAPSTEHGPGWAKTILTTLPWADCVPYAILMFVRWRWLNLAGLVWVAATFAPGALTGRLSA